MSSIITSNYKTIVLFQGGLGDTGWGFLETIEKLASKSSKMINSNIFIDMKSFDIKDNEFYGLNSSGYLTKQSSLAMKFNENIAKIVSLSNNNFFKAILVRTSLSESIDYIEKGKLNYLGFDSVKDQATKLEYVIKAIKAIDSSIRIILVGHSQGGLVNLEVATRIPQYIHKMVSISTPYSPVSMAKKLINLNCLASIFKTNIYQMLESNPKLATKYQERVEDLGTNKLYNEIKSKWENLSYRPQLIVIAGVSGLLTTLIPGTIDPYTGFQGPDTYIKYPFDGLVSISEQQAINHATILGFSDKNLGCYNDKGFMESPCYYQSGFYLSCKKTCCLSSFDLNLSLLKIGIQALGDLISSWVKGTEFKFNLDDYDIIKDIYNGVNGDPISNPNNKNFYNVYKSEYSHQNLRYCDETIANLITVCTI